MRKISIRARHLWVILPMRWLHSAKYGLWFDFAEGCRDLLRQGKDLPRRVLIRGGACRLTSSTPANELRIAGRALTVGFRHGLQSKRSSHRGLTLEHERVIGQVTPLAEALANQGIQLAKDGRGAAGSTSQAGC